jgi:large subunit ribosomal protein L21
MYAVVEIKGKQYRAEKGATLKVDCLEGEKGQSLSFDSVLLLGGESVKVGAPYVAGARVNATILDHVKGDKIVVFKYKPKKDYRVTQGHRQRYSIITVEDIVAK